MKEKVSLYFMQLKGINEAVLGDMVMMEKCPLKENTENEKKIDINAEKQTQFFSVEFEYFIPNC